ncbi:hypothetical protein FRX31_006708 [Thalictrum thalictroides]|uniref:RNase H type-1 domain-containing protein n=1 Tax=Thalictrum thalictroides TaxID=46969 RepID=A0A7J6X5P4_THATH|nr:hypothetical protein FRX31_006708 [Thalictrum thalictroides]
MEYIIYNIIPLYILWEIWKERYLRKYEKHYKPQSHSIIIKIRPPEDYVALNIDGAGQEGEVARWGILRNSRGQHLANFFSYYEQGANNLAETRAILDGLTICQDLCIDKILIQTNSMLLVVKVVPRPGSYSMVSTTTAGGERLIKALTSTMELRIIHVFREGNNSVADYLSKEDLQHTTNGVVNPR